MPKYRRVKGGEKNALSGTPFKREELDEIGDLYIQLKGKGIHENNPKIHQLARKLGRTIRSVENQLLGFRAVATGKTGRKHYNSLIPKIWKEKNEEIESRKETSVLDKNDNQNEAIFQFKISAQLKDRLGRELITDDNIAIFELVKNSFDAYAKKVKIFFEEDKITIWDDGKGMDREDIINKWLFVAYSAKKEGKEDVELKKKEFANYRNKINEKRRFAGSKGIGRFSADRLGSTLKVVTKKASKKSLYWQLEIDWDKFEVDAEDEFVNMEIPYEASDTSEYSGLVHGTILEISDLRTIWPRRKILKLKKSLEKLINPLQELDKDKTLSELDFGIEIICETEKKQDEEEKEEDGYSPRDIVNGPIRNFIFETLSIKTTQIRTRVIEEGVFIETELTDRGTLIYKTKELNTFSYLPDNTVVHLFYLNRSAKTNFTKLMKVEPIKFGSIFLFNNGFRVFPIGEPNDDTFGIDKRKGQGYARFIGLRELIGKIEIYDGGELFTERSSRDGGLHNTVGTDQLKDFVKKTLVKLEKFVQPILWQIKKRTGDENETIDYNAKKQIIDLVESFTGSKEIELIDYSKDFLNIIDNKIENTPPEIFDKLRKIADSINDKIFANEVDQSKIAYIKLKREKEKEEKKRLEAEKRANEAEKKVKKVEEDLKTEKLKTEFYKKQVNSETEVLIHYVKNDSISIKKAVENILDDIRDGNLDEDDLIKDLSFILFHAQKVIKATTMITHVDLSDSDNQIIDLSSFLKGYADNYQIITSENRVKISYNNLGGIYQILASKTELAIIVDNLVNNALTWGAKNILIQSKLTNKDIFKITISDDGSGLSEKYLNQSSIIFNFKETDSQDGSGLGLYLIRNILERMGGEIIFLGNNIYLQGACFEISFSR